MIVAVIVVVGIGAAYFLLTPTRLPTTLPIPQGTTFSMNDTWHWAAYFNVTTSGSRLVGGWTAYDGFGEEVLWVMNGSVAPPGGPVLIHCPLEQRWSVYNGTINRPVGVGPHTLLWAYGCAMASRIVVMETIRLT